MKIQVISNVFFRNILLIAKPNALLLEERNPALTDKTHNLQF